MLGEQGDIHNLHVDRLHIIPVGFQHRVIPGKGVCRLPVMILECLVGNLEISQRPLLGEVVIDFIILPVGSQLLLVVLPALCRIALRDQLASLIPVKAGGDSHVDLTLRVHALIGFHLLSGNGSVCSDPETQQGAVIHGGDVRDAEVCADVEVLELGALGKGSDTRDMGVAHFQIQQLLAAGKGRQIGNTGHGDYHNLQIRHIGNKGEVREIGVVPEVQIPYLRAVFEASGVAVVQPSALGWF